MMAIENVAEALRQRVLFLDGGWGASIGQRNPREEDYAGHPGCYDYLAISRPDILEDVHIAFLEAGCDIVETNTFGAGGVELAEFGLADRCREINRKAAEIARRTADAHATPQKPRFVAGSIGPGTQLPSLGHIDFDSLEQGYHQQCLGLIEGGADYLQIETVQDLIQGKAALYAGRRAGIELGRPLPIALAVTVEKGKTLLGTDIATAVATFAPYDLLAFGINCSTGPNEMEEPLRILSAICPFPLLIMPNAGFPRWKTGSYGYDLTPEEFAKIMARYVATYGIRLAGGCCGTTSDHIGALIRSADSATPWRPLPFAPAAATSMYSVQELQTEPKPLIIGERTNATGSKKFREALSAEDLEAMVEMAIQQQDEGAHILDLSLAFAGRDETRDYSALVPRLNRDLRIPVAFDTTDPKALETSLKRYAGRCLINSINLEDGGKKAHQVLDLARDFGASLICLCIDEKGMAQTKARKLEAAGKLVDLAMAHGIEPHRLLIDTLTFSLATGDATLANAGEETLQAIEAVKREIPGAWTVLGVSNVSFGFQPYARQTLNSVFLDHAVQKGLDAAILHAGKIVPLDQIPLAERRVAENLIFNRREESADPLSAFLHLFEAKNERRESANQPPDLPLEERLRQDVILGKKKGIIATLEEALQKMPALSIINTLLLPAMLDVGSRFASGAMQLPFVLKAAETMRAAVDSLAPHLHGQAPEAKGSMVLATVRGDIHDIGKNLVDIILRNNGYLIHNIGKDKTREEIIAAIREHAPQYLGLSGLLVKSTLEMKELLGTLDRENIAIPVICGGAALRLDFVQTQLQPGYKGDVFYAADAFNAMAIMEKKKSPNAESKPAVMQTVKPKASLRSCTPLEPPFWGRREAKIAFSDALSRLDKKSLFRDRWKIKSSKQGEAWLEELLRDLPTDAKAEFVAVYGHFRCCRQKDDLQVEKDGQDILFRFPQLPLSGMPSLARFFREDGDVVTFFMVTAGPRYSELGDRLYKENQYQKYLLLHGFGVQLADALAVTLHSRIRDEMKAKSGRGRRFSPGYPSWPDLDDQKKLFRLLAPESIGISLSPADQLIPEQSVSAMVVYHPQATHGIKA